jgi:hypothetical protein
MVSTRSGAEDMEDGIHVLLKCQGNSSEWIAASGVRVQEAFGNHCSTHLHSALKVGWQRSEHGTSDKDFMFAKM